MRMAIAVTLLSGMILTMAFNATMVSIRSAAAASAGDRVTDFNGDGFEDLAIGSYPEDIGSGNSITDAGSVNVIHGSEIGLSAVFDSGTATGLADQGWTQNSPSIQSSAAFDEQFGYSVATGDFDDDGYSDISIGVPNEIIASICCGFGAVNVIYGSELAGLSPLSTIPDQVFNQNSPNVHGVAQPFERFGHALAVGDFNNDGYDDLAVGVPDEDITTAEGTFPNAGAVNIIYGSSDGLSAALAGDGSGNSDQLWSQNSPEIEDLSSFYEYFGFSLASGDFNSDGYDDLGIGVKGEGTSAHPEFPAGVVNVIYGSPTGLSATFVPDQFLQQGSQGIDGSPIPDDEYGYSLASGDFDDDGFDDLAVGVPGDFFGMNGSVSIIYGSSAGLSALTRPDDLWHGDDGGGDDLVGGPTYRLGTSLAVGSFNGDDFDDLAIGTPDTDVLTSEAASIVGAGRVNVIYGSPDGLSRTFVPDQLWHQNSPSIEEIASETEMFGYSLTSGDYNGDGYDELAIGVPREDVNHNTIDFAGAVHVIYGTAQGLSATGFGGAGRADQLFTQNSPDVQGVAEEADFFGWSLG